MDLDLELRLVRFGVAEALEPAPNVDAIQVLDNRVELTRSRALTEWYVNGPLGLEQGFTVHAAPATPAPPSELVWELEVGSGLRLSMRDDTVAFADASSNIVARYGELYARDASGTKLPARMETAGAALRLVVDARGADYPLLIDPLIWIEQQAFYPSDGQYQQRFGETVSVSGELIAVGARWHDTDVLGFPPSGSTGSALLPRIDDGAAYVFTPSEIGWFEQRLAASDAADGDAFGAVAMSGDTLLVGAFGDDDGGLDSGSAYVFGRSGATWTERQKLTASDAAAGAGFGIAVAVDAGTALVGATATPGAFSAPALGAAYVFASSGSTWSEQRKLVPQVGASDDDTFGWSVSISGTSAVIGAPYDDDAALDAGAAYVFTLSGGKWVEEQKLVAADGHVADRFGYSVSISGDTAIVGAPLEDSLGDDSGAAYVFFRSASKWTQQQKLTAADGTTWGWFGQAVALSGDTAAIGANYSASSDNSVYVFGRTAAVWSEQQKLFAREGGGAATRFGAAVAMTDTRIAVGSPGESEYAYVFEATEPYLTGSPCPSGAFSCASGFCVDGFCCATACDGVCQTCADTPGTCTPVVQGAGDPDTCLDACDGAGGCKRVTSVDCVANEECLSGFCADGICCETACTGGCETCRMSLGVCTTRGAGATSRDGACSPYVCTGTSGDCPSSCVSDDDCESTHYCNGGTCQPRTAIAGPCVVTGEADCETAHSCRSCGAGQCVDGYCCFSTCEGACERCNGADLGWPGTSNGTCATAPADIVVDEACTAERTPPAPEPVANSADPTSNGCACSVGTALPTRDGIAALLLLAGAAARRSSILKRSKRHHAASSAKG